MPLSLTTAEKITGPVLSILPMLMGKNAFFLQPHYALYVRAMFALSVIFQLLCYFYIKQRIVAVNNQLKFKDKKMNANEEIEVEKTVYAYDLEECVSAVKSLVFSALIAIFVNWKFKSTQPMFSQAIGIIKPILFSGLFREYIYGQKLLRPWDKNYVYGSCTVENVVATEEDRPEVEEIIEKDDKKENTSSEKSTRRRNKKKKED